MAKTLPYFRWYPHDAAMDARFSALNLEERGLFHACADFSWANDGLPADPQEIRRMLRVERDEFDRSWPRVAEMFPICPDGMLRNARQEEERAYAKSKSDKSTNAVRTRYGRSADVPTDVPPRAYGSGSVSKVKEFQTPKVRTIQPSRFHEWLDGFQGRKADPDSACQAWISVDGDANYEAAFACRERYNASREVSEGKCMEAANFIFQQGRNAWKGDWPKARDSPRQVSKGEARISAAAEMLRKEELRGQI